MSGSLMEETTLNTTETLPEQTMKQTDPYVEQFGRFESEWAGQQPSWVLPLRKAGLARFAELGFPTLKHEDYRFTNLEAIAKLPFQPVTGPLSKEISADVLASFPFAGAGAIEEERLLTDLGYGHGLAGFNHPPGNTLPQFVFNPLHGIAGHTVGHLNVNLVAQGI